jgi:hypothetical protein
MVDVLEVGEAGIDRFGRVIEIKKILSMGWNPVTRLQFWHYGSMQYPSTRRGQQRIVAVFSAKWRGRLLQDRRFATTMR